jgi:hypothetical protein
MPSAFPNPEFSKQETILF